MHRQTKQIKQMEQELIDFRVSSEDEDLVDNVNQSVELTEEEQEPEVPRRVWLT